MKIVAIATVLIVAVIFLSSSFGKLKASSKFKAKQQETKERLLNAYQDSIGKLSSVIRDKLRKP